jgi:hypothetical protein
MNLYYLLFLVLVVTVVKEVCKPAKGSRRRRARPPRATPSEPRGQYRFEPFWKQRPRVEPVFEEKSEPSAFKVPYIARTLMTRSEKQFFNALQRIGTAQQFIVAPQVAMGAIVDIPARFNEGKYKHTNRAGFAQKRLDYVLLDEKSLEPILAIELDDESHDGREAEDQLRNDILAEAGYAILRLDVRDQLSGPAIADHIARVIGPRGMPA